MLSKPVCLAIAICVFVLAAWLYFPLATDHPYTFDEADYMWAGSQGLLGNYVNTHALSFPDFVRKGLELRRAPEERGSFSQYIRATGDIDMYRHYHGPMYAYWLASLGDVGVRRERDFRGSGLLLNFAGATIILIGFWILFPALPPVAGLVACALFVLSRTVLVATTGITPHGLFTLFCVATLFAASRFFRDLNERWFYAAMAAMALALCTVETAALLTAALVLAMLIDHRRIRERWPSLRVFLAFIGKGVLVFLAVMLVARPRGVTQLGVAKGFLTLAYISIYRKTFSPFGPLDLFVAKLTASPWEVSLLGVGVLAGFLLWRRSKYRSELLPFVAFTAVFLTVTLKVTAPYTYYFAPLAASAVVLTAEVFGELWNRLAKPWGLALLAVIVTSLVAQTLQWHAVAQDIHDQRPFSFAVLKALHDRPVPVTQRFYVPYQLVPTLHYYLPDLATVGYDLNYPVAEVARGMESPESAEWTLCEESFCSALDAYQSGFAKEKELLDPLGPSGQPLYLLHPVRRQGGS